MKIFCKLSTVNIWMQQNPEQKYPETCQQTSLAAALTLRILIGPYFIHVALYICIIYICKMSVVKSSSFLILATVPLLVRFPFVALEGSVIPSSPLTCFGFDRNHFAAFNRDRWLKTHSEDLTEELTAWHRSRQAWLGDARRSRRGLEGRRHEARENRGCQELFTHTQALQNHPASIC